MFRSPVLGLAAFPLLVLLFACGESPPPSAPTSSVPTPSTTFSEGPPPLASAPSSSPSSSSSPAAAEEAACGPICKGKTTPELESELQKAVLKAHRCYDNALAKDASLKGKVMLKVSIGTDGSVCQADAVPESSSMQEVGTCVVGMVKAMPFPGAKNQCVAVNIPINFLPKKDKP